MKSLENHEEIKHQRNIIDDIDNKIITLLSKRFNLCIQIAHYKKGKSTPIKQEKREQEILKKRAYQAEKLGIDKKFITTLFQLIMKYSRTVQKEQEGL